MDNFKTHDASAFYETFEPAESKKCFGLNLSLTLNMFEIELHVLSGQSPLQQKKAWISACLTARDGARAVARRYSPPSPCAICRETKLR